MLIEIRQPSAHPRLLKQRSVGDDDDFHIGQAALLKRRRRQTARLREMGKRSWLAIPGERNVVDPAERRRRLIKRRLCEQFSRARKFQKVIQFLLQQDGIDFPQCRRNSPIHAAVNAIEITDLVRVEVDADGKPLRTPRDYRIDVPVLPPGTGVFGKKRKDRHRCPHGSIGGNVRVKKAAPGKSGFEWSCAMACFGLWEKAPITSGGRMACQFRTRLKVRFPPACDEIR